MNLSRGLLIKLKNYELFEQAGVKSLFICLPKRMATKSVFDTLNQAYGSVCNKVRKQLMEVKSKQVKGWKNEEKEKKKRGKKIRKRGTEKIVFFYLPHTLNIY